MTCLKKKTLLSTLRCVTTFIMIAFVLTKIIIKLLLTGPKGNKEFCFPEIPPQGEALRGTLRVKGNRNSLFPKGEVIKCFVIPPDSKWNKNCKTVIWLAYIGCVHSTSGSLNQAVQLKQSFT